MGLREKARRKFSVPRENSMERKITLTLSLGFGITVATRLPTAIAMPEHEVTSPSTAFPFRGIISAGRVALKADAIRFTPDIKRIM